MAKEMKSRLCFNLAENFQRNQNKTDNCQWNQNEKIAPFTINLDLCESEGSSIGDHVAEWPFDFGT